MRPRHLNFSFFGAQIGLVAFFRSLLMSGLKSSWNLSLSDFETVSSLESSWFLHSLFVSSRFLSLTHESNWESRLAGPKKGRGRQGEGKVGGKEVIELLLKLSPSSKVAMA